MNIQNLRPANDYAIKYGAKSIVYGAPGTGKTPIVNTAPRPVLCVIEPGMLSMRGSNVPTWDAFTPKRIDEFFAWITSSNEARNFDTVAIDSLTQMAEVYLTDAQSHNKDGRKAYGELVNKVMMHLNSIYYLQNKHTYLICKQSAVEENSMLRFRPHFPGKELNVQIPHLFDIILHLAVHNIPNAGAYKAFHTVASLEAVARDRSGKLAEYEPCDLTALFAKAMS